MSPSTPVSAPEAPVLLLKTISTPTDAYEEVLSANTSRYRFLPSFVPVLSHEFSRNGLSKLQTLLQERRIGACEECEFGGVIFTSQRAVEAFAQVVQDGNGDPQWPHLQHVPIYSVGPATTRAIKALPQNTPLQVFGEHTGNGGALAQFILEHYRQWYPKRSTLPPLLFPVGEQRRDIIPKTLMDPALPAESRIRVVEEVVYGTGEMKSFPADFQTILKATDHVKSRWVVVFSPTGCDSMLRCLGMLDPATGRVRTTPRDGKTFIATIGPTTRDYLNNTFGFEADICAPTPSPEGVLRGILEFEALSQS